jgi:hypothetical protein
MEWQCWRFMSKFHRFSSGNYHSTIAPYASITAPPPLPLVWGDPDLAPECKLSSLFGKQHCFLNRFPTPVLSGGNGNLKVSGYDLRFPRRWLWRIMSSGMLRLVALVRTDVSEELSASFIRVTRIGELGKTLAVTSNWRTLLIVQRFLSPWWKRR